MDLGIAGRVALVTGGSRGLGRQAALALAREGCKVGICARNADGLDAAVNELHGLNIDASAVQALRTRDDGGGLPALLR